MLNDNEQTIIHEIRKNPYITQQELARILDLSRPTIANLISGLVKKGHIKGKAYVLNETKPIICIGGANIDRKFHIKDKVQFHTSNPIHSTQSAGGVARNIAENLGRLGEDVAFLTACGDDSEWAYIEEVSSPYMNVRHVASFPKESTGTYTAALDESGDMFVAFADMDIFDHLTPTLLEKKAALLGSAACIMADLNCPKETLTFLANFAGNHHIPFILVTVSTPKMSHLPDDLSNVSWLITNIDESKAYLGETITWEDSVDKWLATGISHAVVTNGDQGAMIASMEGSVQHVPAIKQEKVIDVTGAGDAFSAAVIHTWLRGENLNNIARAGIVNASLTLQSPFTVRQELSRKQLQKEMEEL